MKKRIVTLSLTAILGTSGVFVPLSKSAYASSFEEKKARIQNERSNVQSNIESKKSEVKELETKQNQLNQEIKKLDEKLLDTGEKIEEKENEIKKTKAEIEQLKKQIAEVKKRIEKRNELLKERAKSLQETGGTISYLDVILGAKSFNDFVTRISAVTTIVDADQKIIEEHERDMKLKEEAEAKLNKQLSSLEEALSELASLKQELDKQIDEKDKLLAQLEAEHGQAMDQLEDLVQQDAMLAKQQKIIEQQQQEYLKRLEEEKTRQAQASQSASKSSDKTVASSDKAAASSDGGSSPEPSVSSAAGSGSFIWPAPGVLTSKMGMRWGRFHAGIDIAKRGTVPVYASAGGTVSYAGQMSGYGNVIMIIHNINGKTYTTLYGHLRSINVSSGQKVSQGQFIGYMGNTGRSTGQHLHFEVHNGTWRGKSSAINPLSVLP
ncbi:peptidoglycan DD-metalloendopeptidase family protein [Aeribacillus sp. FSL K6-1121]|uniref:murein hydrolase activator EnvC family protein n=1 Tax=Aeribacillus sp. FSL K6-1121 TaxID=2954745 RepID=UPI0013997529|nr:peptidase M24 [Aeribacillus pallidus]